MPKSKARKKKSSRKRKLRAPFPAFNPNDTLTIDSTFLGLPKMSDVLLEFMLPYTREGTSDQEWGRIISASIVAWNATLLPWWKRRTMIQNLLEKVIPSENRDDTRLLIKELMYRKKKFFSEEKRIIHECEASRDEHETHLRVRWSY